MIFTLLKDRVVRWISGRIRKLLINESAFLRKTSETRINIESKTLFVYIDRAISSSSNWKKKKKRFERIVGSRKDT